jgi:hypothetical protein
MKNPLWVTLWSSRSGFLATLVVGDTFVLVRISPSPFAVKPDMQVTDVCIIDRLRNHILLIVQQDRRYAQ